MAELLFEVQQEYGSPSFGFEWRPSRFVRYDTSSHLGTIYYANEKGVRRPDRPATIFSDWDLVTNLENWLQNCKARIVAGWGRGSTIRHYALVCDSPMHQSLGDLMCGYNFEHAVRILGVCKAFGHQSAKLVSRPGTCGHPNLAEREDEHAR